MNNGVELELGIKFFRREIILTEKAACDDHTLDLYHTAILNACDRCEEVGKTIGSVTKSYRAQMDPLHITYKVYLSSK